MFRAYLTVLLWIVTISAVAAAQGLCPTGTASPKLVCLIPQVYGTTAFDVKNPNPKDGTGSFQSSFLSNSLSSLQSSLARQSALLPLASPSAGVTFSWDSAAKVFVATTDSYGPILSERADTIGRHRFYIGVSYQYFNFDKIDGRSMRDLPVVMPQADDSTTFADQNITCSLNGNRLGQCGYIRDVITTENHLDLKVHQFTTYMTFGITNRLDVSVEIPISNVRMGIFSTATVSHNDSPFVYRHAFPERPDCPLQVPDPNNTDPPDHSCLVSSFSNVKSASGIGDITLRVKGTPWKGEKAGIATGLDIRLPSGDELNFLGTGTVGFRPFVAMSYRSRVSPHAYVGFEVNGSSQIADIAASKSTKLPSQLLYSAGADIWLTKRLTAAADIIGQEVFSAPRTTRSTFQEPGQCVDDNGTQCALEPATLPPPDTTLVSTASSFNSAALSVGAKFKPVSTLLITANVLISLTDSGLHFKPAPMVGISYTF